MPPRTDKRIRLRRMAPWMVLGLLAWSGFVEPRHLVVRERTLVVPEWPSSYQGMRIALLGDLHVGAPPMDRRRLVSVLSRTSELRPDLILFLGDLVDTKSLFRSHVPLDQVAEDLRLLEAPLGVYGVLGNHDHWFGAERVTRALESGGVRVLENQAVALRTNGPALWLLGVGDDFTRNSDLRGTLAGAGAGPRLIATHSPDLFPEVGDDVALTVAAHTHGGQVRIPGMGPMFVPSRYGSRYARGHFRRGGRHLWVTSGVGNSMVPVRFGVPPEIVVLTIDTR